MNVYLNFFICLLVTLAFAGSLTMVLRSALSGVLAELCGTQPRARFWTLFSMVMLITMPLVIGLGYSPESGADPFFELAHQVGRSMLGYLFTLAVLGGFISVFVLFSPRPRA